MDAKHTPQDISGFDTSREAFRCHWRGFSKYEQPNGSVVAVGCRREGKAIVLGPCRDGLGCDELIRDFYANRVRA